MKKLIVVICLQLVSTMLLNAQTQNNVWSLPPNYYDFNLGTPQPLPGNGATNPNNPYSTPNYNGQPAQYSHNAMQDANGDLLFFVVDGIIYDKNGEAYVNSVMTNNPQYPNNSADYTGFAETMIVPDPGDCNRFYIFSAAGYGGFFKQQPFSNEYISAGYSILDIKTEYDPQNLPGYIAGLEQNATGGFVFNLPNSFASSTVQYATTKLNPVTNERFIFVFSNNLICYKLSAAGITYVSTLSSGIPGGTKIRGELEIVEIVGGNYRLALSYSTPDIPFVQPSEMMVGLMDIYGTTGTLIPGTNDILNYGLCYNSFTLPSGFSNYISVHGLEFSPDGNYLFIIHTKTTQVPSYLDVFTVGSGIFPQPFNNIPNIEDFRFSQVELGKDNKLYFVGDDNFGNTRLATLSNPNTPDFVSLVNSQWADNVLPLTNYPILERTAFSQTIENNTLSFPLPDQIDGQDYTESFFINTACCIENTAYNIESSKANEEQYGTQTWSGNGNNPFVAIGNTVTVKDKLVIKTGANITINNMVFKFAPEALLMIENGAKLTINGTTLTVEDGCDLGKLMWHGVEVWGNGANQFATSGWFMARNNSKIEHAIEATCNYQHDLTSGSPAVNVMVANSTGGIIQLTNTTLRNNVFDVNMIKYQRIISGNLLNDLSFFKNCTFVTDNLLNDPLQILAVHARLSFVNGILFSGCDFLNTAPAGTFPYLLRGTGIQAEETKFMVTSGCTSTSFPCPIANIDKSHFNNLTRGVTAFSNNALKSVQIINSEFYDNWRGIFLRGLNVANVSNNIFDIGMSSGSISTSTVSYGLNLTHCDGYKVENNEFKTSFNGYLGCYVDNSMAGANEIYRNTFNNLVIGSQAVNINGDGTSAGKGLEFRCNQYTETSDYDILVSSGRVKAFHGSCATNQSPSNNQFSYTAQYGDFWMTNNTTPSGFNVSYQFSQPNGYNLEPRDYPNSATHYNNSNTFPSYCSTIFNPLISCPIKVAKTTSQLKAEMAALQLIINDLKTQIDGGNTQGLLNLIATTSGGNLKNALLAASPYLSDEVLVAYILSHPSNGNLKLVLLANSPLSSEVLAVLENISLPQGVANQITAAQTGISPRQELESEISYYEGEITKAQNDIIRILLFEESEDSTRRNFKDVADFLQEDEINNTTKENQLLVNAFMADENFTAAQQKINALATCSCVETLNFCKLKNTIVQCQQYPEKEMVLTTNTSLQQTVNEVATSTTSRQEVTSAQVLLEEVGLNPVILEEIEIITPPSGLRMMNPTETVNGAAISTFVNLFPNPTSNQFTLTHNLALDNGTITLTVFDLMGRKLISEQLNATETVVNTRNLKAGIYFYTVTQNNQSVKTDKLVIE